MVVPAKCEVSQGWSFLPSQTFMHYDSREIPENYHTIALFDHQKMGIIGGKKKAVITPIFMAFKANWVGSSGVFPMQPNQKPKAFSGRKNFVGFVSFPRKLHPPRLVQIELSWVGLWGNGAVLENGGKKKRFFKRTTLPRWWQLKDFFIFYPDPC